MEATELLDQAYGKWKAAAGYCRGYFNLGINNVGKEDYEKYIKDDFQRYKLDDGTLTGLEGLSSDRWFDDEHNRAFVRSVKALVKYRFEIIEILPEVRRVVGTIQYPGWRHWGRKYDDLENEVLLDIQEVGLATDIQLWSFGQQLHATNDDGTQRDPLRIAGDILSSLRGKSFKNFPADCRNHLLQNEEWVEEFFETTRLRTELVCGGKSKEKVVVKQDGRTRKMFRGFTTMTELEFEYGIETRTIKGRVGNRIEFVKYDGDGRYWGVYDSEKGQLKKILAEYARNENKITLIHAEKRKKKTAK